MTLALTGFRLHPVHLPYHRRVTWAGHGEGGVDALVVVLETAGGIEGVGEAPVRINWTGHTVRSLETVLTEVFLPRLMGCDLADAQETARALGRIPEHAVAKALLDIAICDARAQAAGLPLWRWLGATNPRVPVCWTLTRAEPAAMAREAEAHARLHGFTAFKVKTGQGLDTDRAALAAIRAAVGADALLFADANRAYPVEDVARYTALLAEAGAVAAEDPCPLVPDASFARVKAAARVPVLVDHACRSLPAARLFLGADAEALSVKVSKSGLTDSQAIARAAADHGARAHVGIGATGSLGAYVALSLSAALPGGAWLPCEETFFLALADDVTAAPLAVENGAVTLPEAVSLGALIERRRLEVLRA